MSTRLNRTLVGLAAGAALLASAAPGLSDSMARVSGRVTVADSSTPLVATISIRDESGRNVRVKTDRAGRYAAIGFEPGNVTVSFEAPGYVPQGRTCHVPSGETGRFDFRVFTHLTNISRLKYRCDIEPDTVDRTVIH